MSGALYDQLGDALKAQRDRFGADAFDNRRRVISLLADALPEARREIRAIASALDEGAAEALSNVERRLLGMEMDRQADRLEQSVGLRADLARQVIRALAYALDLGPPPSVYEAAPPVSAPPVSAPSSPAPGAPDWAGMSHTAAPQAAFQSGPVVSPDGGGAQPMAGAALAALNTVLFKVQGRAITGLHAALAALGVAIVLLGLPMLSANRGGGQTAAQNVGYADELVDTGVQPKNTLESNVGSPTPMSVPGGRRLTTMEVRDLVNADPNVVLIDVLINQHPATLQGARYLPAAGQPGSFNDAPQAQTAQALQNLAAGRRDRPLIFFCAGSACWESYNAVLRARAAGYTRLYWYRGGLASWSAAGLPMQALPAASN